jgi:hypothetical protein
MALKDARKNVRIRETKDARTLHKMPEKKHSFWKYLLKERVFYIKRAHILEET